MATHVIGSAFNFFPRPEPMVLKYSRGWFMNKHGTYDCRHFTWLYVLGQPLRLANVTFTRPMKYVLSGRRRVARGWAYETCKRIAGDSPWPLSLCRLHHDDGRRTINDISLRDWSTHCPVRHVWDWSTDCPVRHGWDWSTHCPVRLSKSLVHPLSS